MIMDKQVEKAIKTKIKEHFVDNEDTYLQPLTQTRKDTPFYNNLLKMLEKNHRHYNWFFQRKWDDFHRFWVIGLAIEIFVEKKQFRKAVCFKEQKNKGYNEKQFFKVAQLLIDWVKKRRLMGK